MQKTPEQIIDQLTPFLTERRKKRIEEVLNSRLSSVQLAIECPSSIYNALAAVRTCDVLGVAKIHIISPQKDVPEIRNLTKGAFHWVEICFYEGWEEFSQFIQQQQLHLVGGIPNATTSLSEIDIQHPVCLLLGNELRGLSAKSQQACQQLYSIPMYGMTESLNLSAAAAISLYDVTTRKRQQLQQVGDLSHEEKIQQRAQYYLNSIDPRFAKNVQTSAGVDVDAH